MSSLDLRGQLLLSVLVKHMEKVQPGHPETYIGYKEVHDILRLPQLGATWGESLKHQGLSSLADWTFAEGKPAITGIIIDTTLSRPGPGYFRLFGKTDEDFKWWEEQVRSSKEYGWTPYLPLSAFPAAPIASDVEVPAGREEITTHRIIRDTSISRKVKALHRYKCQLCGYSMALPDGSYYAEAHHVRPLGNPHSGPDVIENILCLCPNHHAELDYGVYKIELADIEIVAGHAVNAGYINYHNESVYKGKA